MILKPYGLKIGIKTNRMIAEGRNWIAAIPYLSTRLLSTVASAKSNNELRWLGRITLFFYLLLLKRRRKIIEKYFSGAVFHAEYDYAIADYDRLASKSLISLQNHDQIYRVKSIFWGNNGRVRAEFLKKSSPSKSKVLLQEDMLLVPVRCHYEE